MKYFSILLAALTLPQGVLAQTISPPQATTPTNGAPTAVPTSGGAAATTDPVSGGAASSTVAVTTTVTTPTLNTRGAPPTATPTATLAVLGDKKENNGHASEFLYLRAGAGFSFMGLNTFTSDKLGFEKSSISGPILDVAGGLRLFILTIGPRFRYSMYSAFNMWQLEAEVGIHIPAGQWDPFVSASGGFAQVGSISKEAIENAASTTIDVGDVNIKGWTASLNVGVDYYPVRFFSVGAAASMQLLFLYRAVLEGSPDPTFGTAGASGGIGGTLGVHVGLHL